MNLQSRIDYLNEMLESAKYEARNNPVRIANQFRDLTHTLELAIAELEYIKELKKQQ